MTVDRLVLGTAQFGSDYGLTNAGGRVSDDELERILDTARALGITQLDTALEYGDAQQRLAQWVDDFSITTKVRGASGDGLLGLGASIGRCMEQLGVTVLDGVLIHDWATLSADERGVAAETLSSLASDGTVTSVGVSVYDEEEIAAALLLFPVLSAVQAPVNVLDMRLAASPAVTALRDGGGVLQARSVLLQGLLAAPSHPRAAHPDVSAFHAACASLGISPVAGAVGFVASLPWVDALVIGVTTADELQEIAAAVTALPDVLPLSALASSDRSLIDPRTWS